MALIAKWWNSLWLWACIVVAPTSWAAVDNDNVPITAVQSVAGMLTNLPCNITPSLPGDKVNLVLWYKDGLGKPLYSFDLRGDMADSDGKIWAGEDMAGPNANMKFPSSPANNNNYRAQLYIHSEPTAVLSLLGVTEDDAGSYKCRVDFKRSPTRYWRVNLSVIVPPNSAVVLDEKGSPVTGRIGPFNELSTLILTCDILGGWPSSQVTWWRNGELIDDIYEEIAPGKSRNTMKVETLRREDNGAEFACLGNNNNDTQPISTTVSLEMNLRPLKTILMWDGEPMTAEREYEIRCETFGAQPSATVSWWINGDIRLKDCKTEISPDGNITQSVLKFRPSMQDHGQILSCRAENPVLPNSVIDQGKKMEIYYAPLVSLKLGSNLDETDIKEGDDVYFECHIQANPGAHKVAWMKDGVALSPDSRRGIIINQHSLVIQRVDRVSAGKYVCQATNAAGSGSSDEVQLSVKYIPVCGRPPKGVGVGKNEEARVVCHVDSNPPPTDFYWQFNTTTEVNDLPDENVLIDNSISIATYIPKSEMDYGTLMCWGRNELGRQRRPCLFHVIPAGKPDPVKDCAVTNKTFSSIFIECKPGYNGGLQQYFIIEVFPMSAIDTNTLSQHNHQGTTSESTSPVTTSSMTETKMASSQGRLTSPISTVKNIHFPQFSVEGLNAGTAFGIVVYAQNSKGDSEKVVLRAFTLKNDHGHQLDQPEAKLGVDNQRQQRQVYPVVWIVGLVATIMALVIILLGFVIHTRCFTFRGAPRNGGTSSRSGARLVKDHKQGPGGGSSNKKQKRKGKGAWKNGTMKFPYQEQKEQSHQLLHTNNSLNHHDPLLTDARETSAVDGGAFHVASSSGGLTSQSSTQQSVFSQQDGTLIPKHLSYHHHHHHHPHQHPQQQQQQQQQHHQPPHQHQHAPPHLMSPMCLSVSGKYLTNPRGSVCLEDQPRRHDKNKALMSYLHYTTLPRNSSALYHANPGSSQDSQTPLLYPRPPSTTSSHHPSHSQHGMGPLRTVEDRPRTSTSDQDMEVNYVELSLPNSQTGYVRSNHAANQGFDQVMPPNSSSFSTTSSTFRPSCQTSPRDVMDLLPPEVMDPEQPVVYATINHSASASSALGAPSSPGGNVGNHDRTRDGTAASAAGGPATAPSSSSSSSSVLPPPVPPEFADPPVFTSTDQTPSGSNNQGELFNGAGGPTSLSLPLASSSTNLTRF